MSRPNDSARPLLLPQNRRLRHLQGIYLRNLSFVQNRARAVDDSSISSGSPNKLEALKKTPQLHHAASSESLRPQRPTHIRRRSTTITNKSPFTRQKHLELAIESKAADVFFSLHVAGHAEPVYISEVEERSTNFNFQFFNLDGADSSITRSFKFTVRVWAKRQDEWIYLLEEVVDLRLLNFIGTMRDHQFPPNCLIIHLIDGVYAIDVPSVSLPPKSGPVLPTSSYNQLMKLSNLEASIQDEVATQDSIAAQINEILERAPPDTVAEAQEAAKLAAKFLAAQQRAVKATRARRDDLELSIAARRAAIQQGRALQEQAMEDINNASPKLMASAVALASTREAIRGQRRRICEDLAQIFPITEAQSGSLAFRICGLSLPNTDYDPSSSSSSEDALSAALGLVAQVTNALQYYLSTPLPYPIITYGSRSSIRDDISQIPDTQRSFPLFLRGGLTAQHRFDYGWFLLNKDIEALCSASGLKVVDIRHTLPNLKYLFYVCTAGTDDLPERKRGGVRGLWAGRMKGKMGSMSVVVDDGGGSSAGGSRRGSNDSDALAKQQKEELRKAIGAGAAENGELKSGNAAARMPNDVDDLPFDEDAKLTLRTKGLRENRDK